MHAGAARASRNGQRGLIFDALVAGHVRRNPFGALLTAAAIAFGVASYVTADLTSAFADRAIRTSVLGASLHADLQVVGGGKRVTLENLRNVRDVPGVREARPVVEGSATLRTARGLATTVNVQAIDTLQSFPGSNAARSYDPGPFAPPAPFDYALIERRGIVLSRPLATKLELVPGSTVDVIVGRSPVALKVVLIVPALTVGLDADTILVDIATASKVLGGDRTLDRIDVVTAEVPLEAVRRRIARVLPRDARVLRSSERIESLERLTAGFRLNAGVLADVALALGAVLVANSVGISVRRRRPEIAVLRSLGVTRPQIARVFLSEGALLGAFGATAGALAGYAFALAISGFGDPVSVVESGAQIAADTTRLARGIGIGLILSLASAMAPAIEAASVLPATALQVVPRRPSRATSVRFATTGIALTLACVAAAYGSTTASRSSVAYLSTLGYLIGIGLCVPFVFSNAIRFGSRFAARFSVSGRLAIARLDANQTRFYLTIVTLVISVSASISVATAAASFKQTIHAWALRDMPGDLEIHTVGIHANSTNALRERIARLPGVALISPATASDTASLRSSTDSMFVAAESSATLESLRREIVTAASPQAVEVSTSRDARAAEEGLFNGSLSLAAAVGRVSVAIAIISTVATLMALVSDQRRELVLLRIIGLALAPMRQMIVYEALALAAFGALLGVIAGLVLGATIVLAIDPHITGYAENYVVPFGTAIATPLVVVVVAMLAAAVSARLVAGSYTARRATGSAALHADG